MTIASGSPIVSADLLLEHNSNGSHQHPPKCLLFYQMNGTTIAASGAGWATNSSVFVGTENLARIPVIAGVLKNLQVETISAQSANNTLVFTVYVEGVATAIVVTVPAGGGAAVRIDNTHTVTVTLGQRVSVQGFNHANVSSAQITGITLELDPS